MKARAFLILAGFLAFSLIAVLPTIRAAFAVTPVTVHTAADTTDTEQRLVCFSNGYYLVFYQANTSSGPENYSYSQTGAAGTWTAGGIVAPNGNGFAAIFTSYCDQSGNIYVAYANSTSSLTHFFYRQGTTSHGVITWSFTQVPLTCTFNGLSCYVRSIYAFDTSHVWIAVFGQGSGGTKSAEAWGCSSTCSSGSNWGARMVDSTSFNCWSFCNIVGLSSTSKIMLVAEGNSPPAQFASYSTTNGGSTWGSTVLSSANYQSANGADYQDCTHLADRVYCGAVDSTQKQVWVLSINTTSSWTETKVDTFAAANSGLHVTIAAKSPYLAIFYPDTTSGQIDQQISNNTASSWTKSTFVTGETGIVQLGSTWSIDVGLSAVIWTAGSTVRFASALIIPPVHVPITCTMFEPGPKANLTLSGANPVPSSVLCDGSLHTINATFGSTLTATEPSGSPTQRYAFSGGAQSMNYTTCSSGTCSPWTFTNYFQVNESWTWNPPLPCLVCTPQVPQVTASTLGSNFNFNLHATDGTVNTQTKIWKWVDNDTAWTTPNPFFFDLANWVPSPSGGTILASATITISYSGGLPSSSSSCFTDSIQDFIHGNWLCGSAMTYGNLIGVSWFFGLIALEIPGVLYLKNGNVGLTLLILVCVFGLFGVGAGSFAGNFLPGALQTLGIAVATIGIAGIIYKIYAGRTIG